MTYSVNVTNLNPESSQKSISEFFSFCGTIASIHYDSASHTATVNFEKLQAAKTALMLNGGTLDGATISVTSDSVSDEHHNEAPAYGAPGATTEGTDGYEQHDKPRAGTVVELLAKGYVLSGQILGKAIIFDEKQGISTRFLNYIKGLDVAIGQKIGGPDTTVSDKAKSILAQGHAQAKSIDEQHGITKQAGDYYSRAIASPLGQKVAALYTQTAEQVAEVREEVREEAERIAAAEKQKAGSAAPSTAATGYAAAGHTDVPAATTTAPGAAY